MTGGARVLAAVVLASTLTLAVPAAGSVSYTEPDPRGHRVFTIRSAKVTESSSLVVSTTRDGLAYTANDSGDSATIYAIDTATGAVVGQTLLAGVEAVDIEAMAGGDDGSLVVADIGDNDAERNVVAVYRVEQPGRGGHEVVADEVQLTYVDGPRNAEAVLYDARSGRVFVVSKQTVGASIYATPRRVFGRDQAVLEPVAAAPGLATDATFLPGGDFAVVRTYVGAVVYRYPDWRPLRNVALPSQRQGESVAAPPGGRMIWVGSEGTHSDVLAVRLPVRPNGPISPQPATPTAATSQTAAPASSASPVVGDPGPGRSGDSTAGSQWGTASVVASMLGGAVVVGLLAGWLLRRRPR